jgi:hypothetical protein
MNVDTKSAMRFARRAKQMNVGLVGAILEIEAGAVMGNESVPHFMSGRGSVW